jgi:DNA-binding GntR family transcriptional regulator
VRRAFHDLVTEGLVYRVPGRGTFAAQPDGRYLRQFGSIEDLMSLSADTNMELLSTLQRRVDLEAAGRLRLDTDIVYTMVFRRLHDVTPFCVTTVHLPPHIAEYLSDVTELAKPGNTSPATIIGLLDERMPLPIAEAEQSITVAQAHPLAVTVLSCKPGDCLLRIDRLYMTLDGEPVEIAVSFYLPEHYSYRVHLRRSVP